MISSQEAEQSVAGAIVMDAGAYDRARILVGPDDFTNQTARMIYEAASDLDEDGTQIDPITLSEKIKARTGESRLSDIAAFAGNTPSSANLENYCTILRDYSQRREMLALIQPILSGDMRADEMRAAITKAGESSGSHEETGLQSFHDVIQAGLQSVTDAVDRHNNRGSAGIPWGIPALDARTGGWGDGRLIGIAARPGIGKTAMLNQCGLHAASKGHSGLICSLEMSDSELGVRSLSHKTGLNFTQLTYGRGDDCGLVHTAARDSEIANLPIFLDTASYSLDAILSRIVATHRRHGIKWAAVDHLGLIEASGFNSRNDQIGHQTRALKKLAKRLHIPIVLAIQLNRGNERDNRPPRLSDLRDSGNIEQDLDVCLAIHKPEPDEKTVAFHILKNRTGRTGPCSENIEFDGQTQTFREIADWQASYHMDSA